MKITINNNIFEVTDLDGEVFFSLIDSIHHNTLKKAAKEMVESLNNTSLDAAIKQLDNGNNMFSLYIIGEDVMNHIMFEDMFTKLNNNAHPSEFNLDL